MLFRSPLSCGPLSRSASLRQLTTNISAKHAELTALLLHRRRNVRPRPLRRAKHLEPPVKLEREWSSCTRLHQPTASATTSVELTSVRVRLELGDGRLGLLDRAELNDSGSLRTPALEEDFGLLDFARRLEELDQILVTRRPWQLRTGRQRSSKARGRERDERS